MRLRVLTIEVEFHVGFDASADAVFARGTSEGRLSRMLSGEIGVEIEGRIETSDGTVVDVEEVVVEEGREVLFRGRRLVKKGLRW